MRELPVLVLALVLPVLVLAPVHIGVCNSVRALTVVENDGGGGGRRRRQRRRQQQSKVVGVCGCSIVVVVFYCYLQA